jgi:penicillin-binding protein 2
MFERRLKILLGVVLACTAALMGRAVQVQLVQGGYWRQRAADSMRRFVSTDTTRGRILDFRGRELAVDEPCSDAGVDYRAIVKDEAWMRSVAQQRLARDSEEWKQADKVRRAQLLAGEVRAVGADIDRMWQTLASMSGRTPEEIEQVKLGIQQRVEMRRRYVWYRKYEQAMERHEGREPEPWYRQWLISGQSAPQLDQFAITVEEEAQSHVILRAIDDATYIALGKMLDKCPGLELRHGKRRLYPRGSAASHVIGHMGIVTRDDLAGDPDVADDRRQYLPNDLIGRTGVEAAYERILRGSRGRIERHAGRDDPFSVVDPSAGRDVRLTIDAELQADIQRALEKKRELHNEAGQLVETRQDLHGAAVLIHVPTGEVRAMVSCPTFDLNRVDADYARLVRNDIDKPLLNRATLAAYEPGSTVKIVVALGALIDEKLTLDSTIECTGYLVLRGTRYLTGRCWLARQYAGRGIDVRHHKHPANAPHPTGFLNCVDAIQRSCNVFYETAADMMGMDRLVYWFDQFGLGRRTGVGIAESAGRVPDPAQLPRSSLASSTWYAGIGQGPVSATPIQMANLAATVARGGAAMRPTLVVDERAGDRQAATQGVGPLDPQRDKAYVDAVRQGMVRVVNTAAGTGPWAWREDMVVAGKTGSAQAGVFRIPRRDEAGNIVYRERRGADGRTSRRPEWIEVPPNSYPWYQGTGENRTDLSHAWFIGFAPADKPQIAFAVLVEYGGSGGRVAGAVARDVLEAAVQHGYLAPTP